MDYGTCSFDPQNTLHLVLLVATTSTTVLSALKKPCDVRKTTYIRVVLAAKLNAIRGTGHLATILASNACVDTFVVVPSAVLPQLTCTTRG